MKSIRFFSCFLIFLLLIGCANDSTKKPPVQNSKSDQVRADAPLKFDMASLRSFNFKYYVELMEFVDAGINGAYEQIASDKWRQVQQESILLGSGPYDLWYFVPEEKFVKVSNESIQVSQDRYSAEQYWRRTNDL